MSAATTCSGWRPTTRRGSTTRSTSVLCAQASFDELVESLGGPLPDEGREDVDVVSELIAGAEPGLVGSQTGRYFGFVFGSALPASVAADWVASAWDQNAFSVVTSPAAAAAEEVAARVARRAARPAGRRLERLRHRCAGREHDRARRRAAPRARRGGLGRRRATGSPARPPIRVVAGDERHVTIDRSLRLLGLGTRARRRSCRRTSRAGCAPTRCATRSRRCGAAAHRLRAGRQRQHRRRSIRSARSPTRRAARGAWLHVDGAFGLWAAASPRLAAPRRRRRARRLLGDRRAQVAQRARTTAASSSAAHPESHGAAMTVAASYLASAPTAASPSDWVPESSRRARGFAVWAALRSLGRDGVADLVERCCAQARRIRRAARRRAGVEILNDVVLNQVLVRFGDDDETTRAVVRRVQADGTCWLGGTDWQGRAAMRISVSSCRTTSEDVERRAAAILEAAAAVSGSLRRDRVRLASSSSGSGSSSGGSPPVACASACASSQSASHGFRGRSGPCRYVPTARPTRHPRSPTRRRSRSRRRRGRAARAPASSRVRPAWFSKPASVRRSPGSSSHSSSTSPIIRRSPGDGLVREEADARHRGRRSVEVAAAEQLVAAADGEQGRAGRDRLLDRGALARRGRARSAPARGPGRRRCRRGRARRRRTLVAERDRRTSSSCPRSAARRASTAMLPRSA